MESLGQRFDPGRRYGTSLIVHKRQLASSLPVWSSQLVGWHDSRRQRRRVCR